MEIIIKWTNHNIICLEHNDDMTMRWIAIEWQTPFTLRYTGLRRKAIEERKEKEKRARFLLIFFILDFFFIHLENESNCSQINSEQIFDMIEYELRLWDDDDDDDEAKYGFLRNRECRSWK